MQYEFPLVEWIYAAQTRKTLEAMLEAIRADRPIDRLLACKDLAYVTRVVHEQVRKQFPEKDRPIVEVVLNAYDAGRNREVDSRVDIRASGTHIEIADNGRSMSLEQLLTYLILPFSTQKNDTEDAGYIGQFGIGFFSALKYCIEDPSYARVVVRTETGGEGYEAHFAAATNDVASLRMLLRKRRRSSGTGTAVVIKKYSDVDALRRYVNEEVKGIPTVLCEITFNGLLVNHDGGVWSRAQVSFRNDAGETRVQPIGVQRIQDRRVVLTSMGVLVEEYSCATDAGIKVLFPSLVRLVMGRNAFVRDENYAAGVQGAFVALHEMIDAMLNVPSEPQFPGIRQYFIEIVTSLLGACSLDSLNDVACIGELEDALLKGKKYVTAEKEYAALQCFADVSDFFVASPQGCAIWGRRFRSYQDYLNALPTLWKGTLQGAHAAGIGQGQYPNIGLVIDEIHSAVKEVIITHTSPKYPFMIEDASGALYVNSAHEYVSGPRDSFKRSMAYVEFLRLPKIKAQHTGADYIERQMMTVSGRIP